MATRFVDTNVLLRYLTKDDPAKAERALSLLLRVERGEERVALSPLVVFETIFTLQHQYHEPREQIRDTVSDLLSLRGVELPDKRLFQRALELYAQRPISFADAYNAVYLQARGLSEIYSWDGDFDKLPGIERVEP
jgi:uncharacterized protein